MTSENNQGNQKCLKGKLFITAKLQILTGLHIGGNSEFAPIGAVDSPFIRDTLTHEPIIPGSSIKGKLRTLLAKNRCDGYILNAVENDDKIVARLFGNADKKNLCPARLQFFDLFISPGSLEQFNNLDTDTYIGEIKFENTINRLSGIATPRQIERVPAGVEFDFKLVYNIENIEEVDDDLVTLAEGFELLHTDYLGGHGSRGYGRVKLHDFKLKVVGNSQPDLDIDLYTDDFERSSSL